MFKTPLLMILRNKESQTIMNTHFPQHNLNLSSKAKGEYKALDDYWKLYNKTRAVFHVEDQKFQRKIQILAV